MSLSLWTVYARPDDYPNGYIARRFVLDKPTGDTRTGATLDEVRSLLPRGLTRIARHPADDPRIVEVWL